MDMPTVIRAARGQQPADLLLTDGRIVNVFSGEIQTGNIAIAAGFVVGFGDYPARTVCSLQGRYVAPGFIDPHVHIESAMASVTEFARVLVARGTTTVVADPHEIANVLGAAGIDYMLQSAESQPLNVYYTLPSCVPATELETAGARLGAAELETFWRHPRIVGLGEMMNYPGVLEADPMVLAKLAAARRWGKPIDGHAPGLSGKDLYAYLAAGIRSDHECTRRDEALEKIRTGMHVMIREGTGAKNLAELLPVITARTARQCMWCTDDRHAQDLLQEGHIDAMVRAAIAAGLEPVTAIQLATINPARYFGFGHLGAVAPGRQADLVVFSDLNEPHIEAVYCRGVLTAEAGRVLPSIARPAPPMLPGAMHLATDHLDFAIPVGGAHIHVIEIVPGQILTGRSVQPVARNGNLAVADPERDLLKIAVIDRHSGSGRMGAGFVRGLGLRHGAVASSVAHDTHNVIVAGADDADMQAAVAAVAETGGGLAVVDGGRLRARLPLPIAGLMSDQPLKTVANQLDVLGQAARELGCRLPDPFMTLSFLALPVIPQLKITDRGLIDVETFAPIPLFV